MASAKAPQKAPAPTFDSAADQQPEDQQNSAEQTQLGEGQGNQPAKKSGKIGKPSGQQATGVVVEAAQQSAAGPQQPAGGQGQQARAVIPPARSSAVLPPDWGDLRRSFQRPSSTSPGLAMQSSVGFFSHFISSFARAYLDFLQGFQPNWASSAWINSKNSFSEPSLSSSSHSPMGDWPLLARIFPQS